MKPSILIALAFGLAATACSSDEDTAYSIGSLVGTWQQTSAYDGETGEWYTENEQLVFREDGTGEEIWNEGGQSGSDPFTYTVRSNTIIQDYDCDNDFEGDISVARIERLTRTELVIAGDYRGEDGRKYTDKVYFERVE